MGGRRQVGWTLVGLFGVALALSVLPLPEKLRPFPTLLSNPRHAVLAALWPRAIAPQAPKALAVLEDVARGEDEPLPEEPGGEPGAPGEPTPRRREPPPLSKREEAQRRAWTRALEQLAAPGSPVVDPCLEWTKTGCARTGLQPFFESLEEVKDGRRQVSRVVVFGTSLIASDHITDVARMVLQREHGNAGKGLLYVDRPTRGAGRTVRTGLASEEWTIEKLTDEKPRTDLGLNGVAFSSPADKPQSARFDARGQAVAHLYAMAEPGAGSVAITIDGKPADELPLAGQKAPRFFSVEIPPGAKKLELTAKGAVRVDAVVLESAQPGVVLDSLGLPGASARVLLRANPEVFAAQLKHRDPSLVVVMMGGNEAYEISEGRYGDTAARKNLEDVLDRIKDIVPGSTCLLASPPDAGVFKLDRTISFREQTKVMAKMMREVAQKKGCGYYDMQAAMGGEGAVARWYDAKLMNEDLVHPLGAGGDLIGFQFATALEAARLKRRQALRAQGPAQPRALAPLRPLVPWVLRADPDAGARLSPDGGVRRRRAEGHDGGSALLLDGGVRRRRVESDDGGAALLLDGGVRRRRVESGDGGSSLLLDGGTRRPPGDADGGRPPEFLLLPDGGVRRRRSSADGGEAYLLLPDGGVRRRRGPDGGLLSAGAGEEPRFVTLPDGGVRQRDAEGERELWIRLPDGGFRKRLPPPDAGAPPEPAQLAQHPGVENAGALFGFFERLERLERDKQGRVAIAQLGASHTASHFFTDEARLLMARRFGYAGRGYVAAGKASNRLEASGVSRTLTGRWEMKDASRVKTPWLPWSLTGTRATGNAGASLTVRFDEPVQLADDTSRIQVFLLEAADGGQAEVLVDGRVQQARPPAASEEPAVAVVDFALPAGPHSVTVRNAGPGRLSVLGVSHELVRPGVVWDALGLPGSTVVTLSRYEPRALEVQLAARQPSLFVMFYGTNEASRPAPYLEKVKVAWPGVLGSLKRASPDAACLLIGPTDRQYRRRGRWTPAPSTEEVYEVLRAVAKEHGCAVWSAWESMGGPGSIGVWRGFEPPWANKDRVHLTHEGYRALAGAFVGDLLSAYDSWRASR